MILLMLRRGKGESGWDMRDSSLASLSAFSFPEMLQWLGIHWRAMLSLNFPSGTHKTLSELFIRTLTKKGHARQVKLFLERKLCPLRAVSKFSTLKGIKFDPITTYGLQKLIENFERTDSFDAKSSGEGKRVAVVTVEDVTTALQDQKNSGAGTNSTQEFGRLLDIPTTT